jgi:hypothetical protein
MAIVLRSTKNAALTFVEMDGNFTDLNTRVTAIDSAYVQARVNPAASLDSAEALSLIDSAYISGKGFVTSSGLDSSGVTSLVDSAYVTAKGFLSISSLQTEITASDSFGSFKTRILAL